MTKKKRENRSILNSPVLTLVLAAMIAGGNSVLSKVGLAVVPTFSFLFLRFAFGFLVLLPFVLRENKSKAGYGKLLKISLLSVINIVFFAFGVRLTTAISAQSLYVAVPILTVIISYLFFGKKMRRSTLGGVLIGFLGGIALIFLPLLQAGQGVAVGSLSGNLLVLGGVIAFTIYSLLSKELQKDHSPLMITFAFIGLTLAVTGLFVPAEIMRSIEWIGRLNARVIGSILYTGVLGTGVFYLLYQRAIKLASPVVATLVFYLLPLASFVWAYVILGERLTVAFLISVVLIFVGARIVTRK